MTRRRIEIGLIIVCLVAAPVGVFVAAGGGSAAASPISQARSMMLQAGIKPGTCVQHGASEVTCTVAIPTCGPGGSSSGTVCAEAVFIQESTDGGAIKCPQGPLFTPQCRVTVSATP